jgi:hypothetical protein
VNAGCDHETFRLVRNADNCWESGKFIRDYNALVDRFNDLLVRHNKLVGRFNRNIATVQSVGRPPATSEAQQATILKHHRAGKSSRWIADEMNLSRGAVRTVIEKANGTDRTTMGRRKKLGLESPRKDWRDAARERLPKQLTKHLEKGRELRKAAKGLR